VTDHLIDGAVSGERFRPLVLPASLLPEMFLVSFRNRSSSPSSFFPPNSRPVLDPRRRIFPLGLVISTLFFYIVLVLATLLCYSDYLPHLRRVLVIGIVTVTLVTFILGFSFAGAFETPGRWTHYIGVVTDYWVQWKDDDYEWIKWFYHRTSMNTSSRTHVWITLRRYMTLSVSE
jgi:hypothetical protein